MSIAVVFRNKFNQLIVESVVNELIAAGFTLSLESDELLVERTNDPKKIIKHLQSCDEEWMSVFSDDSEEGFGWIDLRYYNDRNIDVIHDYSTNLTPYLTETLKLYGRLQNPDAWSIVLK